MKNIKFSGHHNSGGDGSHLLCVAFLREPARKNTKTLNKQLHWIVFPRELSKVAMAFERRGMQRPIDLTIEKSAFKYTVLKVEMQLKQALKSNSSVSVV